MSRTTKQGISSGLKRFLFFESRRDGPKLAQGQAAEAAALGQGVQNGYLPFFPNPACRADGPANRIGKKAGVGVG
jgi:hypothetical protein